MQHSESMWPTELPVPVDEYASGLPKDAAVVAPAIPAGPPPITARSYTFCIVINLPNFKKRMAIMAIQLCLPD